MRSAFCVSVSFGSWAREKRDVSNIEINKRIVTEVFVFITAGNFLVKLLD
jgi:hypothetical protein